MMYSVAVFVSVSYIFYVRSQALFTNTCFVVSQSDLEELKESNRSLLPSWVLYRMLKLNDNKVTLSHYF